MTHDDDDLAYLKGLGARLRQWRAAQGVTQEEVAHRAGFSRSYYNEIETGKRNISLLNLRKIALCLGVELAFLLTEPNQTSPSPTTPIPHDE